VPGVGDARGAPFRLILRAKSSLVNLERFAVGTFWRRSMVKTSISTLGKRRKELLQKRN
jgi:hypothetical protein